MIVSQILKGRGDDKLAIIIIIHNNQSMVIIVILRNIMIVIIEGFIGIFNNWVLRVFDTLILIVSWRIRKAKLLPFTPAMTS